MRFLLPSIMVLGALMATHSYALDMSLGVGGLYSGVSQTGGSNASNTAWYSGPGFLGEVRFGLGSITRRKVLSLEIFGNYLYSSLSNTNATINETNKRTSFGGGLDIFIKRFFIGAQVDSVTSEIKTNGTLSATLKFPEYSVRAGIRFPLGKRFSMTIGGSAGLNSTDFTNTDGQSIHSTGKDYRGFITIRMSLFNGRRSRDNQ